MTTVNQINIGLASSTGTGAFALSTSPTLTKPSLVTPILATPTSGNIQNCTNIPWGTINGSLVTCNTISGSVTASQLKNLVASPVQILSAQGANTCIMVFRLFFYFIYVTPVYTTSGTQVLQLKYSNFIDQVSGNFMGNAALTGAFDSIAVAPLGVSVGTTGSINSGLYVCNSEATDISAGNGYLNYFLQYNVFNIV